MSAACVKLSLMMSFVKSKSSLVNRDICALLTINRFFVAYRDIACTLYPVVPDTASFEDTLIFMLSNRARALRDNLELDPNKPYGVSLPFLSLVFAVFASGSQSSDRPARERELTSQVYGEYKHW